MAQTGYTPILLYSSTTAAQAPAAGNLTNSTFGSELAINITDGKLFYKDNTNAVQVIAWKTTPTTAGGTGLTSYTAGDLPYYATGTTLSKLAIGSSGQILTSTGTAPQWTTLSGVAVTTFSAGTTGFTPSVATSGAITLAGTLATTNGGTGLTSFTANRVFYASSTSAIGSSANLTFNGTTLTANDITNSSLTATRVTYAGTGGNLIDSANLTFDGTTLTSGGYSTGGNLTFTGTGNRITGDFSNATIANRIAFQTSTTDSATVVAALPNGTNTISQWRAYNSNDPTNAAWIGIVANGLSQAQLISGISGTGTYLPLTMYTGGSERLRIDTSGNVGIGTNAPNFRLQAYNNAAASSIAATGDGFASNLISDRYSSDVNPANLIIRKARGSQASPTAVNSGDNISFLNFSAYGGSNYRGIAAILAGVETYTSDTNISGFLTFNVNSGSTFSTERMRMFASGGISINDTTDPGVGNLRLATGNLVIGTSGKGIDFSATAGTGTSELLADYEEGTWDPIIGGSGGSAGQVYAQRTGRYTKIGRMVYVFFDVGLSALTSITGTPQIQGLPFTSANNSGMGGVIQYFANLNINVITVFPLTNTNATSADLYKTTAAAATNGAALANTDITATTRFWGTIVYQV